MIRIERAAAAARWRALAIALVTPVLAAWALQTPVRGDAPQVVAQRRIAGVLVTFDFDQTAPTTDQVTILFSNAPANDTRRPPSAQSPLGEGVVARFTFPVKQHSTSPTHVTYSERALDRNFLDCRYIRVVNQGSRPWSATTISLNVAGQRILDRVAMYPRKGVNPKAGIAGWNPSAWRPVFWEAELFRYTHRAKVY